jgi:DNA-binding PadR family transcriptional regulator
MIGAKGPCTPYALRREFIKSPSQYWSASSGAVYPIVLRLRRRGLIRVHGKARDGREGKDYVLTASGLCALRGWLGTLDAPASVSVPPDPLRNRVAFFALLAPREQHKLLDRAVKAMRAHLARVHAHTEMLRAQDQPNEYLVSDGARRMVKARLEWLVTVAQALGGSSG